MAESIRYLDLHPFLPEDASQELKDSFNALFATLLLNSALAGMRAGGPVNSRVAVRSADRALEKLQLDDSDKGEVLIYLSFPIQVPRLISLLNQFSLPMHLTAKALYRRGLAKSALNELDAAEQDLARASELVKDDASILGELEKIRARRKEKRDKEKKAYKKMFG